MSRWLLACAAAWLALDLGRSWNGHRAYRTPSVWGSAPGAELAWPPGADLPPETPLGRRVFVERCAVCHGTDGRGGGPAAPSLRPRPRDLTAGALKFRSTPPGSPPSEADLTRTVRDGLVNSAMPYFSDLLSDHELRAVVGYVGELGGTSTAAPIPIPPPSLGSDAAERGHRVYDRLGCAACHGADGGLRQRFDGPTWIAPDLRQPWTFRGGSAPEQVWLRLTTGISPGPMPSYAASATDEERWEVVAWLRSIAIPAPWEPGGTLSGLGQSADLGLRGDYLGHAQICQLCHTPASLSGVYDAETRRLAGGVRVDAWPHGTQVSRNLTDTRWSEDELMAIVRDGQRPDRQVSVWAMTWAVFRSMTDDDARALARYLRSLQPMPREIPDVVHYGVVETVVAKLVLGLPAAWPHRLVYSDGDAAGLPSRAPVERALVCAQWVLVGVAGLGLLAARKVAGLVALALVGVGVDAVFRTPTHPLVGPERVEGATLAGLPPADGVLTERGRYLFTVASCVMCHNPTGEGGAKLSWKPFGTIYARNLTADGTNGLGRWTDAEIARALRSGISRDGRALHWQGMPWDLFSNLDEEDVRAIVSYLRALPPVAFAVNAPVPATAEDCDSYSLFLLPPNQPPGCR